MHEIEYNEAIEHAASLAAVCDRLKIAGDHREAQLAKERLRGAVDTLAFIYDRTPEAIMVDIRACLALDNLM